MRQVIVLQAVVTEEVVVAADIIVPAADEAMAVAVEDDKMKKIISMRGTKVLRICFFSRRYLPLSFK